jgi:hypothetical protein
MNREFTRHQKLPRLEWAGLSAPDVTTSLVPAHPSEGPARSSLAEAVGRGTKKPSAPRAKERTATKSAWI